MKYLETLAILAVALAFPTFADDQIDRELGREKVRTLSVVNARAGTEKIYRVGDAEGRLLPRGLQNAESGQVRDVIRRVTSGAPLHTIKLARNQETATAACYYYRDYYSHYYPGYYYPNYYYGGGFYYTGLGYGYGSLWNYYGSYHYPYYGDCYWGW